MFSHPHSSRTPVAGRRLPSGAFAAKFGQMSSRAAAKRAFSLIETTLAIGIVAFAFVGILGLMPIGLTSFRKAMDMSTNSRIVQQVATDLQQGTNVLAQQPILYFDEQGDRIASATEADGTKALYYVNMVVAPSTTLPGGVSPDLATVTVEIVKNPENAALSRNPATLAVIEQPGQQVWRYPVFIATQNL